ncbi:MAG: hypothetical protein KBB64_02085 [Bacteroidia bacterium]|nr:hypothetical protein [Bacteroidia bacterium]
MKTLHFSFKRVLLILVLQAPMISMAQTPEDATVSLTPDTGGSVKGLFFVLLPDTNNLDAVEILLGSAEDTTDLVNYTFAFDVTTGLPSGFSWNRDGLKVYMNVGSFPLTDLRYGKVRLRRTGQGFGADYAFVAN